MMGAIMKRAVLPSITVFGVMTWTIFPFLYEMTSSNRTKAMLPKPALEAIF
jgi:hypothetical protein